MITPKKGEGFKAPPHRQTGGSTLKVVNWQGDDIQSTEKTPSYKELFLQESLENGKKNEQFLAALFLHDEVNNIRAKQLYGETRLTRRVFDFKKSGLLIGRHYSQRNSEGQPRPTYFLPSDCIPLAKRRLNELRVNRSKPAILDWEVSHAE